MTLSLFPDVLLFSSWFTRKSIHTPDFFLEFIYWISFNKHPWHLFNFESLRWGTYWEAALNRKRCLFQSKRNYSLEMSNLLNFLVLINNKQIPSWHMVLNIPGLLVTFIFSLSVYLLHMHFNLVIVML